MPPPTVPLLVELFHPPPPLVVPLLLLLLVEPADAPHAPALKATTTAALHVPTTPARVVLFIEFSFRKIKQECNRKALRRH